MRNRIGLLVLWLCLGGATWSVAVAQPLADADMEAAGREAWQTYGTPVVVEKSPEAHSGKQSLHVVTDNKETMGGNYEGTSHSLGELKQGDTVHLSFWYRVKESHGLTIGVGRTQFTGVWYLGGTGWQPAALEYRVRQPGWHSTWISQGSVATDFLLDDFTVTVTPRPELPLVDAPAPAEALSVNGWTFAKATGALLRRELPAAGEAAPVRFRAVPWLRLQLLGKDGVSSEEVPFARLKLKTASQSGPPLGLVRVAYEVRDEPIELITTLLGSSSGHVSVIASVVNRSQRTVLGLTMPDLYGVKPDGDPAKWTLVNPWVCGHIVQDPLKTDGVDTGYPGRGVMGWMDLAGEKSGLYLGIHDGTGQGARLQAVPSPDGAMDLSTSFEICVRPGKSWTSPAVVLAQHPGDWHAGADLYRTLSAADHVPRDGVSYTPLAKPDVPQWMYDSNGWLLVGLQNGIPFRCLTDVYRQGAWMGLEYLHVQGEGMDNSWTDAAGNRHWHDLTLVYPSPQHGTPEELREQVAEIHAEGGHVMFYILPAHYTPSHANSEDLGTGKRSDLPPDVKLHDDQWFLDNALVEMPGATPPTENAFMDERTMCPASPAWREWLRWWAVDYYAKKIGADGMYWDVTGRVGPERCFNARHGHDGENDWAKGCAELLKTVVTEGRRINPDYTAAIEGCSDVLGQWVGYHLMSGATDDQRVFRYTFPSYLLVDGFANHYRPWTMPQKAHRVFLEGEKFDVFGYHQYVKRVIDLRRRIKPFIDWPAVYRDDVGLQISDPKVQARRFDRMDGRNRVVTITMLNEAHVAGAFIKLDGVLTPRTINVFHMDGRVERGPLSRAAKAATIAVPAEDISAAVIVQDVAPELQVVPFLQQMDSPGDNGLLLTMFLPLEQARASVDSHLPERFHPDLADVPMANSCLRAMKMVDPANLQDVPRWQKVSVDLTWQGHKATAWTMLAPPLVNGNFERAKADGYLDYWNVKPDATNPGEGKNCVRVDPTPGGFNHVLALTPLKRNCRYRLSGMIRREAADVGGSATIIEYLEGNEFVRSGSIEPTKSGEWERLTTEFTTHPDPRSTALYLYNFSKTGAVWFDDLKIEEIR